MTGVSIISVKPKAPISVESGNTPVKQNPHGTRCKPVLISIGLMVVSITAIVAVWIVTTAPKDAKESIKKGTVVVHTKDGHTTTETITIRGEEVEEIHVPGQGAVIYDYKRFLMVMHLENAKEVCYVTGLNDTVKPSLNVPAITEMIEPDYVKKTWYKHTNIVVDANLLPQSARNTCKTFVWVETVNNTALPNIRIKRSPCNPLCIQVCRPDPPGCQSMCSPCPPW